MLKKKKLPKQATMVVPPMPTADDLVSFEVEFARGILTAAGVAPSLIARYETGEMSSTKDIPQESFCETTGMIRGSARPLYAAEYLRSVYFFRTALKENRIEDVAIWANSAGALQILIRPEKGLRNHWAGGRMRAEEKRLKRSKEIDPLIRDEWAKMSTEDRRHKAADVLSALLEKRGVRRAPRTCLDDIKRLNLRG